MSPNSAPDKPDSGGRLSFSPVSPLLIRPNTEGRFAVYLKQGGRFVLYTSMGESFTPDHRNKLFDLGIKEVFILTDERKAYDGYLEDNLGPLLLDEAIPLEERSGALYEASLPWSRTSFPKNCLGR